MMSLMALQAYIDAVYRIISVKNESFSIFNGKIIIGHTIFNIPSFLL